MAPHRQDKKHQQRIDPTNDMYRPARDAVHANSFINNPNLTADDQFYLKNIQGTYKVQLDQWRDEGHAFQLVLIWDHDRIWGSFDFGSYKGILKIDKGPERAPPHEDGVSEYVQTYHHFTWRSTCTQSPKSIINNPVFTKGKIELESDGISGYFLGMPNIGLPGGRCDFEGLPVWGPRRVARKLESFIEDWNALKIIQLDEAPRPQADNMVTL